MINPGQLAGMTERAYGTGAVTGLSVEPVRQAYKERRDYERKQQDSIYEITADLDAQAYATLNNDVNQLFDDVANKKIYYDQPEMKGRLAALRGKAKAMSEADAILKATVEQVYKDPNKKVFYGEDAKGNRVAMGAEEFTRSLDEMREMKFDRPEDYIQATTSILQRVGSKIDAQQVVPKIQKTVSELTDGLHKTIAAAKAAAQESGRPQTIPIGNSMVQINSDTDISEFKPMVVKEVQRLYPDELSEMAALERGLTGSTLSDEEFSEKAIGDMFIPTRRDSEIRNIPQTTTTSSRKGSGGLKNVRVEDVTGDVNTAIENADTKSVEKYLNSLGFNSEFNTKSNEFRFFTTKSVGGELVPDDVFRFRPDDAEGMIRFILSQNKEFLDPQETIDEFSPKTPDADKATKSAMTKKIESIPAKWKKNTETSDRRSLINDLVNEYNIQGVEFPNTIILNDYVLIDGEKYTNPEEIQQKLMDKVLNKSESAPAKAQGTQATGVGSKYNIKP